MLIVNNKYISLNKLLCESVVSESRFSGDTDWKKYGPAVIKKILDGEAIKLGDGEVSITIKDILSSKEWSKFKKELDSLKDSEKAEGFNNLIAGNEKLSNEFGLNTGRAKKAWSQIYKGDFSGKGDSFPSAEQMETVIAYAFNIRKDPNSVGENNFALQDVKKSEKAKYIAYYEANDIWLDELVRGIPLECGFLYKQPHTPASQEWNVAYNSNEIDGTISGPVVGKKEDKKVTPKTDLIDVSGKFKFSLKKADSSQIMSGTKAEAQATLQCVLNYCIENDEFANSTIVKINKELQAGIKDLFSDEEGKAWIPRTEKSNIDEKAAAEVHKKLTEIVRDVLNMDRDFKYQVLLEALSGNIKFGNNSPAAANYMLMWEENTGKACKIQSVADYAKQHLDDIKIDIKFKSSKGYSNTVLRFSTVNKKIKNAVEDAVEDVKNDIAEDSSSTSKRKNSRKSSVKQTASKSRNSR